MNCPHCGKKINAGQLLRSIKSEARSATSRENGRKGGRPVTKRADTALREIAKQVCLEQGLPWTDPRSGKTFKP